MNAVVCRTIFALALATASVVSAQERHRLGGAPVKIDKVPANMNAAIVAAIQKESASVKLGFDESRLVYVDAGDGEIMASAPIQDYASVIRKGTLDWDVIGFIHLAHQRN